MSKSEFIYVAYIRTTPKKLWAALTNRKIIEKYWFGLQIETDWKVGSKWKFYSDDCVMDSGIILENVLHKRLVRSWQNEWKPELKAEGMSRCTYELEQTGRSVKLCVIHSMKKPNSKLIKAVSEGWPMCISNLKSLLETGKIALSEHPGHEE
jgi:uncharacterized protein YndB with AHSA1/START domain